MEALRVGLGERRYRVERGFGDLPQDRGLVSDVAVDSRGHLFVLLRRDSQTALGGPAVVELAPDGERLAMWGEEIADAHMITIVDAEIYVVDRDAHEVRVYGLDGGLIRCLGERDRPGEPFSHPTSVAVMPDGRVAVADGYGNACVHVFSAQGQRLGTFGQLGIEPGDFLLPHAVCAVGADEILVADRENHRVQRFDLEGRLQGIWTGFFRPQAIWADGRGHVLVVDSIPSLALFDEDGKRLGRCRPVLNGAHGISGDQVSGTVYLAETNPSRLTRLVVERA